MNAEDREWEARKLRLSVLEGRRAATDGFMWNAPVLTLAVQAFLLQILARDVPWGVATPVAIAGALATSAAAAALHILQDRERDFAQRVQCDADALRLGQLRRQRPSQRSRDDPRELVGYVVWSIVLIVFVLVDAIVLAVTQECAWLLVPVLVSPPLAYGVAAAYSCRIRQRDDTAEQSSA